jgi:rfaE bifunctional protein nucleotidyltransferase chain/domain
LEPMFEPGTEKIRTIDETAGIRERLRAAGMTFVLTNGCFDVIHVGHVRYLEAARGLGDYLLVLVNADASVRALKGPERPLVPEQERAEIIAALGCVDCVVIFSEMTAEGIVERLRPDVYVKGGDHSEEEIPEAKVARRVGARLVLIPPVVGKSTSALVDRICRRKP